MSKKSLFAILAMILIALSNAAPLYAADKEFDAFWLKFKNAVQKNDKGAIVSMIRCPFLFQSKQLTKAELAAQVGKVLPPKTRRCLVAQHPQVAQNDSYSAFCGDLIYTFSRVNGHFMLTDIDAND